MFETTNQVSMWKWPLPQNFLTFHFLQRLDSIKNTTGTTIYIYIYIYYYYYVQVRYIHALAWIAGVYFTSLSFSHFSAPLTIHHDTAFRRTGAWVGNGLLGRGMRHPQGAWRAPALKGPTSAQFPCHLGQRRGHVNFRRKDIAAKSSIYHLLISIYI